MDMTSVLQWGGFFLACVVAALSASVYRPGLWYQQLVKPRWTPPSPVFPIVWTALYLMIATAGWLAWRDAGAARSLVLAAFGVNLLLNGLWSYLFFGRRRIDWAMVDMLALWLSIAGLIALFWPINATAGALLLPYLLWVSIAGALNWSILRTNLPEGSARPRPAG